MTDLPRTPAAEELFHLIFRHQRIPTYVGHGQRCTGCDHLNGETDGPNSPRHTQHLVDLILAAEWVDREQYRDQLKRVAVLETWKDEAMEVMTGLEELGKALDLPLGSRITGTLAMETVARLTAEVERLTRSVGAFSSARDAAKKGWQDAKDKVARVEALRDAEIADVIERRIRSARGDVRCLDCNIRYEERSEYGCHTMGHIHDFDQGDLAAAEEIERSNPVEYVTLSVADLSAALADPERDEEPA
jgi:hypothetical protein